MEISINGRLARLKKNTSFEYICENRMFTGSDSYTLTITFPLKDCMENIYIFGQINRKDVEKTKVVFDCEIRDRDFCKSGSITITEINDVEVKTQFLEGRSEQNFDDTFDDIYINQLALGYPTSLKPADNPPVSVWLDVWPNINWVALPWVNNTSGNLQNPCEYSSSSGYAWTGTANLSFQPYLLYILYKVCEVIGYTGDFEAIKDSTYRYLIICNTLPAAWDIRNFAVALPHWSLTEFFEELEKLLMGEFDINHKAKTIRFQFTNKIEHDTRKVEITDIVNRYTVEVSREEQTDYLNASNLVYADNDNRYWAYRSCQWYIKEHREDALVYETLADLLTYARTLQVSGYYRTETAHGYREVYTRGYPGSSDGNRLFYAEDVDTYFIMWCYKAELIKTETSRGTTYNWYKYYNRLEPINQFGKYEVDEDADDIELGCVPAWIDDTDEELGPCLFLECGEMDSAESWTDETDESGTTGSGSSSGGVSYGGNTWVENIQGRVPDETDYNSGALPRGTTGRAIAYGEQDKSDAYFDCLYLGFWDGVNRNNGFLPHPITDIVELTNDFDAKYSTYSFRLGRDNTNETGIINWGRNIIEGKKKYSFSFLADSIPNPRAVFYIEGRKYICEKITATFQAESGMSQLMKGVFYRITE